MSAICRVSIEGGRTIRTWLDCGWVTTQIVDGHSFRVAASPDLVIGYLIQVAHTGPDPNLSQLQTVRNLVPQIG